MTTHRPSTFAQRALHTVEGRCVVACVCLFLAANAAAQAPAPLDRFVTVNGLRIHYVDWGQTEQPPLILIHGLDRVARTFDHVVPHFTSRYRVIAVDMRGHGDSDWDPQARYVVDDHVSDLEGLVAQLGLRNITLWGNSTGGRVVQVFAGKHPDLVAKVISEDVGPERPQQISDSYARRVKQEDQWRSLCPTPVDVVNAETVDGKKAIRKLRFRSCGCEQNNEGSEEDSHEWKCSRKSPRPPATTYQRRPRSRAAA